jgi:group I intron endonuclease
MKVIYAILNLKTKKLYIGSTNNFSRRKNQHIKDLNRNKHHSTKLQNAWNKYSEKMFHFVIIETLSEEDNIMEREQYYMDLYKSYDKGYNVSKSSNRPDTTITWRPVYQFLLDGTFIKKYPNAVHAGEENNCDSSGLRKCAIEKYRFYAGFIWSFEKTLSQERIFLANNPVKRTEETKEKMSISAKNRTDHKIPIIQYDLEENFVKEWDSAQSIYNTLGISTGQICDTARGKHKQARGFIWKYKNEINEK